MMRMQSERFIADIWISLRSSEYRSFVEDVDGSRDEADYIYEPD